MRKVKNITSLSILSLIGGSSCTTNLQSNSNPEMVESDMENLTTASKSDHYRFIPTFGFINFFDSDCGVRFGEEDIDDAEYRTRIRKREGYFALFPTDALYVDVALHLAANPPDIYETANFDHIVESIISVSSGILCVSDDIPPRGEFLLDKNSNYKFRAYFSEYDCENDSTTLNIHFWPTTELETNAIEVLKQTREFDAEHNN